MTPADLVLRSIEIRLKPLEDKTSGLTGSFKAFLQSVRPLGVYPRLTPAYIVLSHVRAPHLATIVPKDGKAYFDFMATEIRKAGTRREYEAFAIYYTRLAELVGLQSNLSQDLKKTRGLLLSQLLQKSGDWTEAIRGYLDSAKSS
jgi:hypothetical protein